MRPGARGQGRETGGKWRIKVVSIEKEGFKGLKVWEIAKDLSV